MTTGSATVSPATRRSILLLSFATFSSMAVQRICDAMLPELSRSFSVSLTQAAQVVSVFAVVYGLAQLVYGPLGDRFSKFGIVTFATLACSIGSIVAVFASTLDMLLVARVMVAMGAAAVIPLSMAWVGDTVAYELRQEMLARIGLGTTLGLVSGLLVGGVMTDLLGWRWAFVLMTLLYAVVGVLLYADWRRQLAAPQPVAAAPPGPRASYMRQAWGILTGRWSRIVLLVIMIEGAAGFGVLAIWASHLHKVLGLSLTASGAIVALFGLGGMAYMATARSLIRRWGERGLALIGGGTAGVGALVLGLSPWWQLAVPASLLSGFGFFMLHNTLQTNATQMAPHARGTAMSMFAAMLFTGQSIGVLVAASLSGRIGSVAVVSLGGVILIALGAAFSAGIRQRDALMQA
ncbi:MAG: MFS transporter [Polaromonas sp.]|nr:MFS transporter [Polaromonas sp.]